MINKLTYALAVRLKELYPDFNIYDEAVIQGLKEPCFFINIINWDIKKELHNRYRLNVSFSLHYLNKKHNENMNHDFKAVGYNLGEKLEVLELENIKVRITSKGTKQVDDVLHILFDVSMLLFREEAEALILAYELEGGLK